MAARWLTSGGAAVSSALAVAGVAALLVAAGDQRPAPPAVTARSAAPTPVPAPHRPSGPAPSERDNSKVPSLDDPLVGPLLDESEPVSVRIPRLGVQARLVRLGLGPGGAMEVPDDPGRPGWYTGAPTPGALGPAVVVGHVTWDGDPAVFFRLGELRPGDQVDVRREDGRVAVFAVRRVAGYPKERFPTRAVYGPLDHAGLRLLTCGGRYDAARNRYPDNVVVFADLVDVRRR